MIRKTLMIAALAAAVALPGIGSVAYAAPKAAPTQTAPAKQPSYAEIHAAVVKSLNGMTAAMKNDPQFGPALAGLNDEVAKLAPLEKAYVDAKNAGNEDAAKKASADYAAQAQKILGIVGPMDQAVQGMMQQVQMGFMQLGETGKKLLGEADVKAAMDNIGTTLKPLADAEKAVAPLASAAEKTAEARVQAELERIQKEEFANAVNNYLNGQAAK